MCRRALGAGPSASPGTAPGACFRLLQYEFLVVKCAKGDFQGLELFVDACFREQFQIPHPTPHYAQLLAAVPEVFVGSRVHLITLVELLCAEVRSRLWAEGHVQEQIESVRACVRLWGVCVRLSAFWGRGVKHCAELCVGKQGAVCREVQKVTLQQLTKWVAKLCACQAPGVARVRLST